MRFIGRWPEPARTGRTVTFRENRATHK